MTLSRTVSLPLLFKQPVCALRLPPPHYAVLPTRSLRTPAKASRLAGTKTPRFARAARDVEQRRIPTAPADFADINFYEADGEGRNSKRRRVSNPDDDLAPLQNDIQEVDDNIKALEEDIEDSQAPTEATEEEALKVFTEDELETVGKNFIETLEQHGQVQNEDAFNIMPHHVRASDDMEAIPRVFLSKLNDALNDASMDATNTEAGKTLWRHYERAKIYVPNLLSMMPDQMWQLLWVSQSEDSPENPNRASHLKTLAQDMVKAGKILTEEQRFARLEGMFWSGKQDEALALWEEGLKQGDARNTAFLEMGIRMYAYDQKMDRSMELVDVLFKLHPDADPRILLQLISASVGIRTEVEFQRAWKIYQLFKEKLTSEVTMEDYDEISLAFLRADQKDWAFAVFRDMMLAGEVKQTDSGLYTALGRFASLIGSAKRPSTVNSMSLESLTFLPRKYQNKFFYASWMKRLIGMGEFEGASQVLDLMYERGIEPDAKHVNGLVNVWLNGDARPAQKQGEQIAWAMVQKRANFVHQRQQRSDHNTSDSEVQKSVYDVPDSNSPASERASIPRPDIARPIPAATIETFCLLVQFYLRRGMMGNVRHLRDMLVTCEIPMNAYFMNHLLRAETKYRTHKDVFTRYKIMSRTVKPDLETFNILWDCCDTHVNPVLQEEPHGFPFPRELMKHTLEWFHSLQGQQLRDARLDMEIDTYNCILRCFCYDRDPAANFVALYILKEVFGMTPAPSTLRLLVMHVSRLTMPRPTSHRMARKITAAEETEENIKRITEVLGTITQLRERAYEEQGKDPRTLDDVQVKEEQARVAMQLMYTTIEQLHGAEGGTEVDATKLIVEAAKEMGVEDLDVEDAMGLVL